jgi:hypothetical protein
MKWVTTILALSSAIPAGVVAPTMIIGGLLGRVWGHVILPAWLVDMLLSKNGTLGLSFWVGPAGMRVDEISRYCRWIIPLFLTK